ncbi:MAG: GHKL domain-containing protein, partial [Lachnospiraceae bacterium]|nr:GHKL domain-containing protein [Lachnospiraceae bacterium]
MNLFVLVITLLSSIIGLLLLFITNLFVKIKKANKKLELEISQNENLNMLNDNIRCFKHDFDNIMQSIGGYIFSEDINGLKSYYSKLSNDFIEYKNLSYLNPQTINNPAIYALISSKFKKANELKISFNIETFLDFNTLKINIYEFCKILGILLDNAIEASLESQNKLINLIIRNDKRNNMQLLL